MFGGIVGVLVLGGGVLLVLLIVGVSLLLHARRRRIRAGRTGRAPAARTRRTSWPRNGDPAAEALRTDAEPGDSAPTETLPTESQGEPPTERHPLPGSAAQFSPTPIDSIRARQDPATIRAPLDGQIPPRPTRRPGPLFSDDGDR